MSQPRVSVNCCFLNEARFLAGAVDSVLAQDFDDYELVLVDDGSTDASTAIARDYAACHPARIRYLEHPEHANKGAAASRNLGVAKSNGGLLAFIDADDAWRPAKLGEQVSLMEAHPAVAMLCGQVNYWRSWEGGQDRPTPTGQLRDATSHPPETSLALYPLGKAAAPCPSDAMVRRHVVEAVGGFEESFVGPLQLYEDQLFFSKTYLIAPVNWAGPATIRARPSGRAV